MTDAIESGPAITLRSKIAPHISRLIRRLHKQCRGYSLLDASNGLFAAYSDVLLDGCLDFDQYMRNVENFRDVLEANGREHFKQKN